MPRRIISSVFVFSFIVLGSCALVAQTEFSADVVDLQKAGTPVKARIYFAKDKIRFESAEANAKAGAYIMNLSTQTSTVIMNQQHMYMEIPAQSLNQRQMYNFFQTADVENACADWQKMEHTEGGSCRKVGNETVNGHNAVKYEGSTASGDSGSFSLDLKLRFPLKWQGKDRGGELRNIQEGPQPSSLFEIPAGFTKMDMGGMRQRPQ